MALYAQLNDASITGRGMLIEEDSIRLLLIYLYEDKVEGNI